MIKVSLDEPEPSLVNNCVWNAVHHQLVDLDLPVAIYSDRISLQFGVNCGYLSPANRGSNGPEVQPGSTPLQSTVYTRGWLFLLLNYYD